MNRNFRTGRNLPLFLVSRSCHPLHSTDLFMNHRFIVKTRPLALTIGRETPDFPDDPAIRSRLAASITPTVDAIDFIATFHVHPYQSPPQSMTSTACLESATPRKPRSSVTVQPQGNTEVSSKSLNASGAIRYAFVRSQRHLKEGVGLPMETGRRPDCPLVVE